MMAEYIEREAAIREMYKEPSYYDPVNILTEVRDRIKAIPAADVRPVVRGEWIAVTNGRGGHECGVCHDYAPSFQDGSERLSNYRPSCGARLLGGKNDKQYQLYG